MEQLENLFEKHVSDQDNDFLSAMPSKEGIFGALKQIINHKAQCPDGMIALFYKHYWSIIKKKDHHNDLEFFQKWKLLKQMIHTNIAIIPRIQNPSALSQYLPISLTNVIYKIITKILTNCFKSTLANIIFPLQTTFVSGCNIKENKIIVDELFHHLKRKQGIEV